MKLGCGNQGRLQALQAERPGSGEGCGVGGAETKGRTPLASPPGPAWRRCSLKGVEGQRAPGGGCGAQAPEQVH